MPRWVQLAIEIKIQAETGWNRATVRNLLAEGITIRGSTVELQAVKGKTGEMQHGGTESADRHLLSGLNLMLEHSRHVDAYWKRERQGVFVAMVLKKGGHRVFGTGGGRKSFGRDSLPSTNCRISRASNCATREWRSASSPMRTHMRYRRVWGTPIWQQPRPIFAMR